MDTALQVNRDTTPQFSPLEAATISRRVFGISGAVSKLPSERDQNFLVDALDGRQFVLKIAKSDEDRGVLEFQNAALTQVAVRAPELAVPRLLPSSEGQEISQLNDQSGQAHYVRLISWLEGAMLVDTAPHDAPLLCSLGTTMAQIDLALSELSHSAMHRELHWDVKRADLALQHLPLLPPHQQRAVRGAMLRWSQIDWHKLRHSVIHGDANDHNVLVRHGRVAGLIDFGDLVHSATVCDLAIAMTYAMLSKAEPVEAAAAVVAGYHRRLPLLAVEFDALYSLIGARLCMSICYAAYNARAKSHDAYQQVTAGPAWELLQRLREVTPECALDVWQRACDAREKV